MTYKIEIDADVFDSMMAKALKEAYEDMTFDEQQMKYPRFSRDRNFEIERTYELRKALRLVHNYFSIPSDYIEEPEL
jgi:hypothetical protein